MGKKKSRRKKFVKADVPALVGFTKLMEQHRALAVDMAVVRFANNIVVAQYRGRQAKKEKKKPRKKMAFWIYAVKSGEIVDHNVIHKITQRIDTIAKRFGQKVSWGKRELQVAEYKGEDYMVKGGVINDIFALVPPPDTKASGISAYYGRAFQSLKKAGVNLIDAKKLFPR